MKCNNVKCYLFPLKHTHTHARARAQYEDVSTKSGAQLGSARLRVGADMADIGGEFTLKHSQVGKSFAFQSFNLLLFFFFFFVKLT